MLDNLSVTTASIALAFGISLVALGLMLWLRFERANRDDDLTDLDRDHFTRQDRRRNEGLAILFFLAQGIAISPQVSWRVAGRPNPTFLLMWLAIFLLIMILLALAFIDMLATRVYARRHRDAILQARRDLISQIEQIAHGEHISDEISPPDPESSHD